VIGLAGNGKEVVFACQVRRICWLDRAARTATAHG